MVTWNQYKQMEHKKSWKMPSWKQYKAECKEANMRADFDVKVLKSRNMGGFLFLGTLASMAVAIMLCMGIILLGVYFYNVQPPANSILWLFGAIILYFIPSTALLIAMPKRK